MSESQVIIPEIERAATEAGISPDGVVALRDAFAPHFQAFQALATEAATVGQDEPKRARELRMKVRAVRIAAEKTRTEAKADALRRGKAIDGINNVLLMSLVPIEEGLEKIEKAEELRAAAKREALKQARSADVAPYGDPSFYDLAGMPDAQYADLLAGLKAAHAAKIKAVEDAEIAAREKARAEEAERMRIVQENARLAKIAADEREAREASERAAAQAQAEAAAREKAIRDEAERKAAEAAVLAKIEAEKREAAERQRREKERKERAEADAKAAAALAKERAERERIQAEIAAREKAEVDRIAMEQASAKRAASAPDREKILALASAVGRIEIPELNDNNAANKIREQFASMSRWLVNYSTKIGE